MERGLREFAAQLKRGVLWMDVAFLLASASSGRQKCQQTPMVFDTADLQRAQWTGSNTMIPSFEKHENMAR